MSIHLPATLSSEDLPGKFACKESMMTLQHVGKPVVITKVKGKRIYFKAIDRRWHNDGSSSGHYTWHAPTEETPEEYCALSSLKLICDTVEEAISACVAAQRFFAEDSAYEKRRKAEFFDGALKGTLPELVQKTGVAE